MNVMIKKSLQLGSATLLGLALLTVNDRPPQIIAGALISQANAWIGRPLTPMSYAGVARRTTARAYGYGAVVAAPVVVAPVVVGPACAQVVNVYGQITTVCR